MFSILFPLLFSFQPILLPVSSDSSDGTTSDGSSMAEYQRISAELEKLSKRQIWEGVEKQFLKLEALAVSIEYEHYLLGAQSSQEMGNIYVALQRLKRARSIKKRKSTQDWIDNIEREYGLVNIEVSSRRKRKTANIIPANPPLDPVKIGAINFAQQKIVSEGIFYGMLPLGQYELVGQKFELSTGLTINLRISPFLRSKGLKEPVVINSDDIP